MKDFKETNIDSLPMGDIFAPLRYRNMLFFRVEDEMSSFKGWVFEWGNYEQKMVNKHGKRIVEDVRKLVDNTRATALKVIKPPPVNQLRKLDALLNTRFSRLPLKEFCDAYEAYHDMLKQHNIITDTTDMPTAKERFYM